MSRSSMVVDYENLLDTSFTDSNQTVRTHVRSRWERKKVQQHAASSSSSSSASSSVEDPPPPSDRRSATCGTSNNNNSFGPLGVLSHSTNNANNSFSSNNGGGNGNTGTSGLAANYVGGGDRFIPNRAGMNMDLSKHLLRSSSNQPTSLDHSQSSEAEDSTSHPSNNQGSNVHPNNGQALAKKSVSNDKQEMYASTLSSALFGVDDIKNNRIMSYQEKAPVPQGDTINNLHILYSASGAGTATRGPSASAASQLVSRMIPSAPSRILDAPDLLDDYYLNLVSWNDKNMLAVALAQTVYLWNAGSGEVMELCSLEGDNSNAYISSVSWIQEGGTHLAVGTSMGTTQLWDVPAVKQVRSMDGHSDRVGALSWNRHLLTTGSRDTTIVHHDVRVAHHQVASLTQHSQEVCGLAWSSDGQCLASGGNDNLLCLWDVHTSMNHTATSSSSSSSVRSGTPRFRLTDHQAAVKALAWSPHERHLLATGAGTADRTIKFWHAHTGALLNSVDTGSQVCALLWNPLEKELLSSHGFARHQLTLWKYPSMVKIKEFEGHTARVLHLACSPDGGTVLSAAADETLRFWDMFATAPTAASSSGAWGAGPKRLKDGADGFSRRHASRWTMQIR